MKKLLVLVFCFSFFTSILYSQAPPCPYQDLQGSWSGQVLEIGFGNYDLTAVFDCVSGINIDYSNGLSCGGTWTFVSKSGNEYVFTEAIPSGMGCATAGTVNITHTGNQIYYEWFRLGNPMPFVSGTLIRAVEPIPTVSEWGLISAFLILSILGFIYLRKENQSIVKA